MNGATKSREERTQQELHGQGEGPLGSQDQERREFYTRSGQRLRGFEYRSHVAELVPEQLPWHLVA